MRIHAERLLTPGGWRENQVVEVQNGLIERIFPGTDGDMHCEMLTPGLFDVHAHGGEGFYYYQPESRYSRCFESIDAMAHQIVNDWRDHGTTRWYTMLDGQIATWQELGTALEQVAAGYGLEILYEIWYEHHVEDTYFYITLE